MSKRVLKKMITAIMAATLMVTCSIGVTNVTKTASAAKRTKNGDFKYVKYLNGIKITKYKGKAKKVTIPAKIAGKKVLAIGKLCFEYNENMTQVNIPDSVKKIGDFAFSDCVNLKKVTLPKKMDEIGRGAFTHTAIRKITIPEGIKQINEYTFSECKEIKSVKLSEDVKIIKGSAFEKCEKLSAINLDNIEEIGVSAFRNAKSLAGELVLKNVVSIGTEAFYGCSGITSVSFSDTLQLLGETNSNPFAYCSNIEKFEVDVNNVNYKTLDGVIYGKTNEWIVAYPAKKGGVVNIPDAIIGISEYAFSGAKISQVNMGKGLSVIRKEAFGESEITEVTMPYTESKYATWSKDAFIRCKLLKKVVFPVGTKNSNGVAFLNCSTLAEVILPDGMETLSDGMFLGCTSLERITLPKTVTTIPIGCFYGCKALKNANMDSLNYLSPFSFYGCESLSGVLNLNSTRIKTAAFAGCTGITEVNFNKPVGGILTPDYIYIEMRNDGTNDFNRNFIENEKVEVESCHRFLSDYEINCSVIANPFAGCSKLMKINVNDENGSDIKSVDGVLFTSDMKRIISYPAGLTGKYNIPYGVEQIDNSAFEGVNLSEVVMSNTVTRVNPYAFYNSKIKSVTVSKSVTFLHEILCIFDGCKELEQIKVNAGNSIYESKDGVLYRKVSGKKRELLIYPTSKKGKTFKVSKKTSILSGAFDSCKYLKKVYLTDMKTYDDVDDDYFTNCKNIKLYLPKNFNAKNAIVIAGSKRKYSFGFEYTCKGCKTYVAKGSALAKRLDKKKVKYYKYSDNSL